MFFRKKDRPFRRPAHRQPDAFEIAQQNHAPTLR
jgi:hypothetical protein